MLNSRMGRAGLAAALLTTTMLTAAPQAFAQSTVDELVVTAQKREENLQNVALSIQAIGNEKLEQLQVNNFDDFAKFLPSVSYQTAGPGFTSIFMRGVASGENGNHSGPVPSVGFYLDEQPITTIQGPLDIHVYDIARVESLVGPQGTLYGASSQAGTIRIITNKPKIGVFEGAMDAEVNGVDHGGVGYGLEGFVNVPVTDKAAIRLVGWAQHDAGYVDNILGSRTYPTWGGTDTNEDMVEDNYNDVDTYGARAALKVDLNENWTITPTVMAQDQKAGGSFAYDPRVGDLQLIHFNPESSHDRWIQGALTIEGKIGNLDLTYNGALLKRRTQADADYSDYSYAYDALYGYYVYDNNYNYTNPSQYIQQDDRFTKQSHEFRIATPADNRLRAIAGVFYQRQTHDIQQRYKINNLLDAWEVPGWDDTIWLTKQFRVDTDKAVFGEVSFDITEKLTLTGGLRLFKAENTLEGFFGYGPGYSSKTGVAACPDKTTPYKTAPCLNLDKMVEEDGHTERLNLTYHVDDDRMIYATYSTGYRPGGVNRRGDIPYLSDFLTNYEFGWKTTWFDRRLRWNGAVFFDKWDDFQFSYLGANGLTQINNAGQAEMKGVETDVTLRPSDGLTITAAAAYTDAKTTASYCPDVVNDPGPNCAFPQAPAGQQLPNTPKFKSSLTARYDFPWGGYDAYVQTSLAYQSAVWDDLRTYERALVGRIPAYQTADFSAGVSKDDWSVDVYLKNAFDERGETGRTVQCAVSICADPSLTGFGTVYAYSIRPRMLGLRVGRKF